MTPPPAVYYKERHFPLCKRENIWTSDLKECRLNFNTNQTTTAWGHILTQNISLHPDAKLENGARSYLCDVHDFDGSQLSSLDMTPL